MRKHLIVIVLALSVISALAVTNIYAQDGEETCQDREAVLAEVLGLELDAVNAALESGQSIADLAEAQGVSTAAVAEALAENYKACQIAHFDEIGAELMCGLIEGPRPFGEIRFQSNTQWEVLAAEALGVSPIEVVNRDESIAALAEELGTEVNTVIDAIVEAESQEVYRRVERGRLSQEEADEILNVLEEEVTAFVNADPTSQEPTSLLEVAQDTLGLSSTDFYQALVGGQTLAEIAEANGVNVDDLKAALVDAATNNLALAQARGLISECVATVRLDHLADAVDNYLNETNPGEALFGNRIEANVWAFGEGVVFPNGDIPFLPELEWDSLPAIEIRPGRGEVRVFPRGALENCEFPEVEWKDGELRIDGERIEISPRPFGQDEGWAINCVDVEE